MSVGETRNKYRILVRKSRERDSWQDLSLHRRIILKWNIFVWLDIGTNDGFCEYFNERSSCINFEKFLY
jgi:hypothetical protein